jgi:cytochrome c554/c'-like protein
VGWRLVAWLVALVGVARAGVTYVGAGACAASNCHGSVTARTDAAQSAQNEYMTWFKQDRHARAYEALRSPLGFAIARRMALVPPGAEARSWLDRTTHADACVGCHTVDVPATERGARFDVADGVSCEACHGPAGGWIAEHARQGWTTAQSIARGMVDTRDSAAAAVTCLACHLGTDARKVDHRLIAAGHPSLSFELDTFAANMPSHWVARDDNAGWSAGCAWAVGQAVALREAMRSLGRQVGGGGWPDFTAYDCSACHHDLGARSRWRQDHTDGVPPWDASRAAVALDLAAVVAPDVAARLRASVVALAADVRALTSPGSAADATAAAADDLLARLRRHPLDADQAARVIAAIVADAQPLADAGFRTAQQVAWSLDALALAAGRPESFRTATGRLFDQLADPATYDPARFAHDVAALATVRH